MEIGHLIIGAIGVVIILGGLIVGVEAYRRRSEDKSGFQEFIADGARHTHPKLMSAFSGRPELEKDQKCTLVTIGTFVVEDNGEVYIYDPSLVRQEKIEPIDEKLPAGNHMVDALIFEDRKDQRIAALRVNFSNVEASYLAVAWTVSSRVRAKATRELPSVGVDSATAAIFSAKSLANFSIDERDEGEFVPGVESRNPYLSGNPSDLYRETRYQDGSNLFVVYSGLGDGSYGCFLAKSKDDQIVSLIIDFGFFEEPIRIPVAHA